MRFIYWIVLFCAVLFKPLYALDIKQWHTEKGANVLFVQANDLPIIDIRISFKAGSSRDSNAFGISRLTSALLVEGTGDLSAEDIAIKMESVGAQLGHDSLKDMAFTSLRLLSDTKNRSEIIDLFARVTAKPSFPQDAINRDRVSMITSIDNRKNNIAEVTADAFNKAIYSGHEYEVGFHGRKASLEAVTQSDLFAFHQKYYVAKNASIAIVGDLTEQQAKELSEKLTVYLAEGSAVKELSKPKQTKANIQLIDFDSTQTHIIKGMPVISRKDKDFYSLYVGNHILGGSGFGSRLMTIIREEKGLTYSVYSYFSPMESLGPFVMSMQTANHQVDEARSLLSEILNKFIDKGANQDELSKAKKNITGSFPLKIDSNNKILSYLAVIAFYNLPLSYLDDFNKEIEKVTLESIQDAFKRRVKLDQLVEIVVGPK
ncbi:MAG: insulinase family protein [Gammaproteobacteria bacterium]|nr:insulinase family protein [Gammaproteobacteria bacterium]